MNRPILLLVLGLACSAARSTPVFEGDRLAFPGDYRQWIYLSSGFDMSYSFSPMNMGHDMFDNVFVDPASWAAFQETGTWPDKTMLLIEARRAEDKGSIARAGRFQGEEVMGWEVHVKDSTRFPEQWAFFQFDRARAPAQRVPADAGCDTCHRSHGAVDTTFVQFYPTLLPLATAKGTLSAAYLADSKEGSSSTR